uniref:Uncharacterized protein n=1 Tax=Fagus sylvatica TaxID=28930 RepID=A0A2N9E1L0_FAGSY
MLSLSQLSPSRSGGGYGKLAWYRSRQANLETHLGSRWLRFTSRCLKVVTIGVVLWWWRWASIGSEPCIHSDLLVVVDLLVRRHSMGWVVVDLLVQWAASFLGGGSPVVGCDLCVVCEFSSGYGRL